MCVGASRGQKKMRDTLELELQEVGCEPPVSVWRIGPWFYGRAGGALNHGVTYLSSPWLNFFTREHMCLVHVSMGRPEDNLMSSLKCHLLLQQSLSLA